MAATLPVAAWRKKARGLLYEFNPRKTAGEAQGFLSTVVRPKSILLLEPNDCHAEILPGLAAYFLALGYCVDILVHAQAYAEQPFHRMSDSRLRIFPHSYFSLRKIVAQADFRRYELVVLTSSQYYVCEGKNGAACSFLRIFGSIPQGRLGSCVVEHNLGNVEAFHEQDLLDSGRLITLWRFPGAGQKTLVLNPVHCACPTHEAPKTRQPEKTSPKRFLVLGELKAKRKNIDLLFHALSALQETRPDSVRICLAGDANRKVQASVPENIRPLLDFSGRLSFPRLQACIEKTDFILPLLDSARPEHQRYLNTGVSGIMQIIPCYSTPFLMDRVFADFYGFGPDAGIVYEPGDLLTAMQTALTLPDEACQAMRRTLEAYAHKTFSRSLHDLSKALKTFEQESGKP